MKKKKTSGKPDAPSHDLAGGKPSGVGRSDTHLPPAEELSPALPNGGMWVNVARVLGCVSLSISLYLLWISFTGRGALGCGPASGCDAVLHSRWAYWFGLPVSLGAVGAYVLALAATFRLGPQSSLSHRRFAWGLLSLISLWILGAAAWFVVLQVFVIKAFCPYCMTAHTCGCIMAALILFHAPSASQLFGSGSRWLKWSLAGLGVGVLMGGQLLYVPKTFAVEAGPLAAAVLRPGNPTSAGTNAVATNAVSGEKVQVPPSARLLSLHGGIFELNLREVPVLGSPDAKNVMVSLFDYTCTHCRQVHKYLVQAQQRFSNELAIVSLPTPLDVQCNQLIKKQLPDHTNACVYARLGLAVWLADRSQMAIFDDWLFAPQRPVSTNQAAEQAGRLVGTNALAKALQDPWVQSQLEVDSRLYASNYYRFRHGSLPQLMIGTNIISGTFRPADLDRFLSNQFGLMVKTNAPR